MARPRSGVEHVGRRTETLPNGTRYIYERRTLYDPDTKKTRVLGCRLIGKILPGETEIVPTRPKKPSTRKTLLAAKGKKATAKVESTLLSQLLERLGKESGIDLDLLAFLSGPDARKAISLARFWLVTEGAALSGMDFWQKMHPSCASPVTEEETVELFETLGGSGSGVWEYFSARARELRSDDCLILETSVTACHPGHLPDVREGFDGETSGLPYYCVLTLLSGGEPVAFACQPASHSEPALRALEDLRSLCALRPLIVSDKGCYAEKILRQYSQLGVDFLSLADIRRPWIAGPLRDCESRFNAYRAISPDNCSLRGFRLVGERDFSGQEQEAAEQAANCAA